jgi:cell division protein FtsL
MKDRRHHNTKGFRQIKTGTSFRRLVKIAHKLGMKVQGEEEIKQLTRKEE